jgi:hypothetical protein
MSSAPPAEGRARADLGIGVALVLIAAWGLARAVALAWVCDDAFISFRYADNLVRGHGLVYNVGEYVEGYTNLLWTLWIATGRALGATPEATSKALGIACYAALAGTLAWAAWRRRSDGLPFLPLAAGVVLVSPDFQEWATGGLETMLFTWLASLGCLLAVRGRALAAGLVFAALALTRPDGLLFAAAAAICALPSGGRSSSGTGWRTALALLAPVALTLALLLPWKLYYYGELLPTAFYSKSVLVPYWSQGLRYVGLYAAKNGFLVLALALAAWARWRRRGRDSDRASLLLAGSGLVFLAYISHVGGDFMFARLVLPVVPLLLLAIEEELVRVEGSWRTVLATGCLLAAAFPYPIYSRADPPRIAGIADERRFHPEVALRKRRAQGQALARALDGLDVRVMFSGGMCSFAYYSGLPYLAEMTGLTQYSLARQPLRERGRPGHEKRASREWLIDNGIHLVVHQDYPPLRRPLRENQMRVEGQLDASIVLYDDAIMSTLAAREGVRFTPIARILADRRRSVARSSRRGAEEIYSELDEYYFRSGGPAAQRAARRLRTLVESRP